MNARNITYDRYSLIINGQREFIRSGAMHYFRLPSQELWRDRLFKLKAAGYNTVDLYFCWHYHSPAQGVYDFTGIRDIRRLLQITQELGLHVIARPGPYINAEYSGGGFPGWLLAKKHLPLRNRREGSFEWSDEYMGYVREWWEQIIPILNEAPNIILMQIENEYATLEVEPDYMRALYDMTRELGVKVPLFHNDLYVAGLYEDIVDVYSFDNYSVTQFETDWREMPEIFQVLDNVENNLRPFCENRPLMAAELQAGWYGTWKGYKYEKITELLGREHIGISTKSLLGQGLTIFNHYKAIGGTNWDYTGSIETYTSYDFGAPISEAGVNTERLFESKAINWFLHSFDLTATDRTGDFPMSLSNQECLYAIRAPQARPEARWLFLRNLTYDTKALTVGDRFPVEMKPFEVLILPYRIPLNCGYELEFCTSEALYQNEHTLVLQANRPLTACIQTQTSTPGFTVTDNAGDVCLIDSGQGAVTFRCAELPEKQFRQVQLGELNIILLGQHLIDTFWVQEDGELVVGPEMCLPDNLYGMAQDNQTALSIARTGNDIAAFGPEHSETLIAPLLSDWKIFNDAPELLGGTDTAFQKISQEAADFDANGIYEGSAWYRLMLNGSKPEKIEIDARHFWAACLNGHFLGEGHQLVLIHGMSAPPPTVLSIPDAAWKTSGENELLIFVSGLGHPKGFHDDAQTPQGLLILNIDGQNRIQDAGILPDVYSRRQLVNEATEARLQTFNSSPIVRLQTEFILPTSDKAFAPWGLKLQDLDFERINIYLNGCLIGRYWRDCQCQEIFYLPTGILKTEPDAANCLELILMNFKPFISRDRLNLQPHHVAMHSYEIYTKRLQTAARSDKLKV